MPRAPECIALPWPDFLEWFGEAWKPGEHVATVAPTGAGKTTFNVGLLGLRKYVAAFDPKGGDSTLKGSGFPRLPAWPPSKQDYKAMGEGEARRYLVGPVIRTREDVKRQVEAFGKALDGVFEDGGWTLYIDELQIMADRRFGNLAAPIEELLIAARDKGVSVVSAFQRPANVPRTASDQATWIATAYTRDRDVVTRLSEMLGRPAPEIRGALNGLDKYAWLVVGRDPREPYRVTRPHPVR